MSPLDEPVLPASRVLGGCEHVSGRYNFTYFKLEHEDMDRKPPVAKSIDDYISSFDEPKRTVLLEVRRRIAKAAPNATEKVSYGMPTFHQGENLVHFAAMKNHLGFYPTPSGIAHFAKELTGYVTSKGAIQYPWNQPMPYALMERITRFRVKEAKVKGA
jgi:uncharacterized protein YdhG (YjbR/CyaY superfamily)